MPVKPSCYCGKCRKVHRNNEQCPHRQAYARKRLKQKTSGRGGRTWQKKRERVFIRDKFLCQIHLAKGVMVSVTLHGFNHGVCDHIIPIAEGGTDDDGNLQCICQECDKEKTHAESCITKMPGV